MTTFASNEVWVGLDFGTTHSCAAVWDSNRGRPKWMRLRAVAYPQQNSSKAGRVVPSVLLLATQQFVENSPKELSQLFCSCDNLIQSRRYPNLLACVGARALKLLDDAYRDYEGSEDNAFATRISAALISNIKSSLSTASDTTVEVTPLGGSQSILVPSWDVVGLFLHAMRLSCNEYLNAPTTLRKRLNVPATSTSSSLTTTNTASIGKQQLWDCRHVVIGVPACWKLSQRRQLVRAAQRGDSWYTVHTVTESTAAAQSYGLLFNSGIVKSILVLDMGGGTTDVSIVKVGSKEKSGEVVLTGGLPVGGNDLDRAVYDKVMSQGLGKLAKELHQGRRLLQQCKRAKEQLCGDVDHGEAHPRESVVINISADGYKMPPLQATISQETFRKAIVPCLDKVAEMVQDCLSRYYCSDDVVDCTDVCDSSKTDQPQPVIDEIVLVGGSSRVPALQELLCRLFPDRELCRSVHPMSAVAQGASIQAAIESHVVPVHKLECALMLDCLPHAIGVLTASTDGASSSTFVEILPARATLPANGWATFYLADSEQPGVTIVAAEQIDTDADRYEIIQEFTFLLHRLTVSRDTPRSLEVGMMMQQSGNLMVSIFDSNDPEHVAKRKRQGTSGQISEGVVNSPLGYIPADNELQLSWEQVGLLLALAVCFVLYVLAKSMFVESRLGDLNANGFCDEAQGL